MHYDVVVLGAGVIGLSTAYHLARGGARVAVLDRGEPGAVASGAAAGMLAAQIEPEGDGPLFRFLLYSRERYPEFAARLATETGIDIELVRNGILELAMDDEAAARLKVAARWQTEAGQAARWLSPDEVAERMPGVAGAHGALYAPADGQVLPSRLVAALRAGCARWGVTLLTECEAFQLGAGGSISTTKGPMHAGAIVVATGAYAAGLGTGLPVGPVKGEMIALRLPDGAGGPWQTDLVPVFGPKVLGQAPVYLVPKRDGRVFVGATAEPGFDRSVTLGGVAALARAATALLPALAGAALVDTWTGLRPGTPDGLPIVGALPGRPGTFIATGHYRNGILLTPGTGEVVAALVAGRRPEIDLSPFAPERFDDSFVPGITPADVGP